jgi:hypothetical protein
MNTMRIGKRIAATCLLGLAAFSCAKAEDPPSPPANEQPAEQAFRTTVSQETIRVRKPTGFVQSGFGASLHLEVRAFALTSVEEISNRFAHAISVSDATGHEVSTRVTGAFDGDGIARLDVAFSAPQAANSWYYAVVTGAPGSVELDGGDTSWTMSLYTGDLVYVERVMQPADPAKQDQVRLRFSQPVDFDARWAATALADQDGVAIQGCVPLNGACATSGRLTAREVQIRLPNGGGSKIGRLIPTAMNAVVGHAAVRASSLVAERPMSNGAIPLRLQPCEYGAGRCAYL